MSSLGGLDRSDPPSSSATQSRPSRARGRTESFSSSSDLSHPHHSNGSASLMPPDHNRPRSSSSSSKALLTMALLEAQSAVRLDYTNDIPAALSSYRQAVTLLSRVMEASSSEDEQERLRTIHDSYLFRIHLLSSPPTPTISSGAFAQHSGHAQSTHPGHATQSAQSTHSGYPGYSGQSPSQPQPPQQPLPQPPRLQNTTRPAVLPSLPYITPSLSSGTLSLQQRGDDSESAPVSSSLAAVPPPRRVRKHVPVPLRPTSMASSAMHHPEPRTPRQRSESTSTNEHSNLGGTPGQTRHHTRSHTGGSTPRATGDLVHAAEQLQIHAHQRMPGVPGVPKVRSRDHLVVPISSAPNVPLPPTPTALGPPPSTPPPMPMPQPGYGPAPPGNPPMPSLPSFPPPTTPVPPPPSNFTSPPASPANASRRISPLVPVSSSLGQQHQFQQQQHQFQQQQQQQHLYQQQISQKSSLSLPEGSPEEEKTNGAALNNFYDDDLVSDEWLPNLSTGFSTSETSLEHSLEDPYPRERISSKGSFTGSQLEQLRSKSSQSTIGNGAQDGQKTRESTQHQRSSSQSSNFSNHQPNSSQPASKSPLSTPIYTMQQGASSLGSLHALESTPSKRISDSARSVKESGPLARSSGGSGTTNGSGAAGSSSPLSSSPAQLTSRPTVLQHQYSSSKLSTAISNSNVASPTLDKAWSPSMGGSGSGSGPSGGMTLFDVIADDPFAGMSFPCPPPSIEPPPTDPYFRCFWLMRRLEQTMTTGGFLTKRMYVPRAIWYQSLVRLPAADTKMNACQTLSTLFLKMTKQHQSGHLNLLVEGGPEVDVERMTILKELESLESAAQQVQSKLSKKLSFIHRPGKNGLNLTIATNQGYSEDTQGPVTGGNASVYGGASSIYGSAGYDWGTGEEPPLPSQLDKSTKKGSVSVGGSGSDAGGLKSQWKSFSKSVQKSIGNDKVEDTSTYTEAVIRLFQSSYILESMLRHYNAQSPYQVHIQIVNRLRRLCDILNQVICAFVVRDLGELMGKYVKRVGAWVAD